MARRRGGDDGTDDVEQEDPHVGRAARELLDEPDHRRGGGRTGHHVGRSLDTFVAVTACYGVAVVLARFLGWSPSPVITLTQVALPVALLPVWAASVVAVVRRLPVRGVVCLGVVAVHVMSLLPAIGTDPVPAWAGPDASPAPVRLRLVSANVSARNHDPRLAAALLAARADVLVLVELTRARQDELEQAGAFAAYPYEFDAGDVRTERILIMSRYPLDHSTIESAGRTATPVTTVHIGNRSMRLVGVHAHSPLSTHDAAAQREWLRWARDQARVSPIPIVMAGDFNASRFYPPMGELLAAGMTDAHESRGRGLTTSWPVGGAFLDLPFMRLDHVLHRGDVTVTAISDLDVPGSDHLGIVSELALR